MNYILIVGVITCLAASATCSWLGWLLLQQYGRILLRMEELEKRLEENTESRKQKLIRPTVALTSALSPRKKQKCRDVKRDSATDR